MFTCVVFYRCAIFETPHISMLSQANGWRHSSLVAGPMGQPCSPVFISSIPQRFSICLIVGLWLLVSEHGTASVVMIHLFWQQKFGCVFSGWLYVFSNVAQARILLCLGCLGHGRIDFASMNKTQTTQKYVSTLKHAHSFFTTTKTDARSHIIRTQSQRGYILWHTKSSNRTIIIYNVCLQQWCCWLHNKRASRVFFIVYSPVSVCLWLCVSTACSHVCIWSAL